MKRTVVKILSVILLFVLIVSGSTCAQESDDISTNVSIVIGKTRDAEDGGYVSTSTFLAADVPPYIIDGTTMVPLRALSEAFGYNVSYQEKDKRAIVRDGSGENELIFTVGSTIVFRNGQEDTMLQAPEIRESRMFIPLRYISEFFGKYVTWGVGLNDVVYVWVSVLPYLTREDVAVEDDEENYFLSPDSIGGFPLYELRRDGQTHRGIKIGDSYEKVIELYGEPHDKVLKDGQLYSIRYWTTGLPGTDSADIIRFSFQDDVVYYVIVSI